MNTRLLSNEFLDAKVVDVSVLSRKLSESANKVVAFFESKLQKNGSYGEDAKDIACYFKSPMMFIAANKCQKASIVLSYIQKEFMQSDGDFLTHSKLKSSNQAYSEYWSYTNGWIVRAANLLNASEMVKKGYQYCSRYDLGSAGFLTNKNSEMTDVLSVAHYGLINLEMNKLNSAIIAGSYLCDALRKQPNLRDGFYLRFDKEKNVVKDFSKDMAMFYYINTTQPNQLHFMIGYPAAFLAILYKKTNQQEFLDAAIAYLDFSLSCDSNVYSCNFSHKIAWAASLIYESTGDVRLLSVIDQITSHFIDNQKNDMWFGGDINSSYDQSAEIACWFLDIVKNINAYNMRMRLNKCDHHKLQAESFFSKNTIKCGAVILVAGLGLYSCLKWGRSTTAVGEVVVDLIKPSSGVR